MGEVGLAWERNVLNQNRWDAYRELRVQGSRITMSSLREVTIYKCGGSEWAVQLDRITCSIPATTEDEAKAVATTLWRMRDA